MRLVFLRRRGHFLPNDDLLLLQLGPSRVFYMKFDESPRPSVDISEAKCTQQLPYASTRYVSVGFFRRLLSLRVKLLVLGGPVDQLAMRWLFGKKTLRKIFPGNTGRGVRLLAKNKVTSSACEIRPMLYVMCTFVVDL